MKKIKKFVGMFLLSILCLNITACSEKSVSKGNLMVDKEKTKIIIGTESTTGDAVECTKQVLESMGYEIEFKYFDDFVLPNSALVEGSIDCNVYQHVSYMEEYNKAYDTNLVMAGLIAYPNLGIYSEEYTSVNDIPNNASIGVTLDASNVDRALRLLHKSGIITLTPGEVSSAGLYTVYDIDKNPKNIKIISLEENQLVNALNDVAACVVPSRKMLQNGLDPSSALIMEDPNEEFSIGLTVRAEDVDTPWVKDILKAYTDENTVRAFDEAYKGAWKLLIK